MKIKFVITVCIVVLSLIQSKAQTQDSIKTYNLPSVEVVARKNSQPSDKFYYGTNYESSLFNKNGFNTLRRGANYTQDLYVEGFKRSDIKVVIDGDISRSSGELAGTRDVEGALVDGKSECCGLRSGPVQRAIADLGDGYARRSDASVDVNNACSYGVEGGAVAESKAANIQSSTICRSKGDANRR